MANEEWDLIPEDELREKALALTSLFETSEEYPYNFGVVGGNFDGQGLSFGAIQFNFGQDSLQPILRDLIENHNADFRKAFSNKWDADYFEELILSGDKSRMIQFGENVSDPNNKHIVIAPWKKYFNDWGIQQPSIDRQIEASQWFYEQALVYFDLFDLWSRRGYALMFDISVQSGSISGDAQAKIFQDFKGITATDLREIETAKMIIIANRKADEVKEEWKASYRERKLSIANGSGDVYGGSLHMDTTKYDMILEPAFADRIPIKTMPYEIVSGDTLWKIAEQFKTDIQTIRDLNLDKDLDIIYAGQIINVPFIENWEPPAPEPEEPEPDPIEDTEQNYQYMPSDVENMLHGKSGSRHLRFRFDLLDVNDSKKGELTNVISGSVQMNAFNAVKRTATFRIKEVESEKINFLQDKIQPFAELKMPDKYVTTGDGSRVLRRGGWIEYPLGVFLLSSPKKQEEGDTIYRDIEAYDGLVILQEDRFVERYTIRKGTNYVEAVLDILRSAGIENYNISSTDKELKSDLEYEIGTEKIEPIADLLNAINFTPLWVDDYGYFTSTGYVSPQDKEPDYAYSDDEFSVIAGDMEEELDLYSVPNSWVAVYSDVDGSEEADTIYVSTYKNTSEDSPTSIPSRGRTIVDYRTVEEIADQEALDNFVSRIAYQASQVYGKVRFQTAIMPFHGFQDVLRLNNELLGVNGKYAETSWKINFDSGSLMEHEARKVINI